MDKKTHLKARYLPEYFHDLFSSPHIAGWLGVQIPCLDDLREFVMMNIDNAPPILIDSVFLHYDEKSFEDGFDDRIKCGDVKQIVSFVCENFSRLVAFEEERDESFYLEMGFQLPFIHRSRFTKDEQRLICAPKKTRYYGFFRKHYVGWFHILPVEMDADIIRRDEHCFLPVELVDNRLPDGTAVSMYLQYPCQLKTYWEKAVGEIDVYIDRVRTPRY